MKKWELLYSKSISTGNIVEILLKNRLIISKESREAFLKPDISEITIENVFLNKEQVGKSIERIKKAIHGQEQIVVFGDYDVDGICATAILWETLDGLGAKVIPYIPNRLDEGYGLSEKGISNIKLKFPDVKLIITVDNGIVAFSAVEFAISKGLEVIITDHHVALDKKPKAFCIVHTTKLCGAGIAYILSLELEKAIKPQITKRYNSQLELVVLATIADLVPLTGANRILVKEGLEALKKTRRTGLVELFKEARIDPSKIETYHIGHIIAPRLNAMGRIDSAMESLRLLCTTSHKRAKDLSVKLGLTNSKRQDITVLAIEDAIQKLQKKKPGNLIFISHNYEEGIIGLIAGRLTEKFYRPSIVISQNNKISKGSARSIGGFNIIEFIRNVNHLLINAGGHPMAAGFTVETDKISLLEKTLTESAESIDKKLFTQVIRVDAKIDISKIDRDFFEKIQQLKPYGAGNPQPCFLICDVMIMDMRRFGKESGHVSLTLIDKNVRIEAVVFSLEDSQDLFIGQKIDAVGNLYEDAWNNNIHIKFRIKDFRINK